MKKVSDLIKTKENQESGIKNPELGTGNQELEKPVLSLDEVKQVLEKETEPEKPKRGRKKGSGRKSKAEIEAEKKQAEIKQILQASFAYALVGLTNSVAHLLKDSKWAITDMSEAESLANVTIQYLDERFPDWEQYSPELSLIMGWSTYFIKRFLPGETK